MQSLSQADRPTSGPRSSDRVLTLLRVVAQRPEGITLSDAARDAALAPSTALRQLRGLEAAGFVARDAADGRFLPGPELVRIARSITAAIGLAQEAEPVLRELADLSGESAYLAEPLDRRWAVYTAMAEGRHVLRHVSWLGNRIPRTNTAVGAALAGRVDHRGVAWRTGAVEDGVTAISAPVRRGGRVVAAISVIGPTFRLDEASVDVVSAAVHQLASGLSD